MDPGGDAAVGARRNPLLSDDTLGARRNTLLSDDTLG
jgi:hypothetical protein